MTACTEPHPAWVGNGRDGEGQKSMPSRHSMTACTEPHPAWVGNDRDGEGQKSMPKEGTA
jgi:hypothetical protein